MAAESEWIPPAYFFQAAGNPPCPPEIVVKLVPRNSLWSITERA